MRLRAEARRAIATARLAQSSTNGLFIRNSDCVATVVTYRRPWICVGSGKSNVVNISGSVDRITGR